MGYIVSPQNSCAEALTSSISEHDCIWSWAFKEVLKLKRGP